MSHWRHTMVDGDKFGISYQRLAFLSILSHWQLIQNLAPFIIMWCIVTNWHFFHFNNHQVISADATITKTLISICFDHENMNKNYPKLKKFSLTAKLLQIHFGNLANSTISIYISACIPSRQATQNGMKYFFKDNFSLFIWVQ